MIERTVEIDDAIAPTSSFVQQRHVPPELIHAIISFIPSFDDRLSISLVCRTWAEVVLPRVYRCRAAPEKPEDSDSAVADASVSVP